MGDHVFICYSRKDEDFVIKLAKNLKRQGVPVWLDQWDIPSGSNWNRTIERALNECTSLLVVLSPSSVDSDEVQSEWLSVLSEKKVVVPILYQKCQMPFRLKLIQYIDFTSSSLDDEKSLDQILHALGMAKSIPAPSVAQLELEPEKEKVIQYYKGFPVKSQTISSINEESKYWNNEGRKLRIKAKYNEALENFEKAIELGPQNAEAWFNKGNTLDDIGKSEAAIEAYNKTIELNPGFAEAWYNKGIVFRNMKKEKDAEAAFAKAKELGH